MFAYVGSIHNLKDLKDPKRSQGLKERKSKPEGTEGRSVFLWILFTEGCGICLCCTISKSKGPEGPDGLITKIDLC